MSKKNNVSMPRSGAGVTQYNDVSTSKFQLKPISVIILLVVVILIVIGLHTFNPIFWAL